MVFGSEELDDDECRRSEKTRALRLPGCVSRTADIIGMTNSHVMGLHRYSSSSSTSRLNLHDGTNDGYGGESDGEIDIHLFIYYPRRKKARHCSACPFYSGNASRLTYDWRKPLTPRFPRIEGKARESMQVMAWNFPLILEGGSRCICIYVGSESSLTLARMLYL